MANRPRLSAALQFLDQFFEQSPIFMAVTVGPGHVFARANPKYREILGVPGELLGKTVREVFPEIEAQGYIAKLDQAYRTGEPFRADQALIRRIQADGSERPIYIDFVSQPIRNEKGEIYALAHTGSDVTETVLARKELERSKALAENERENFRNLFRQTPEMVCILTGPQHVFEFVNEAQIRALGFDATGMKVREAQPESVEVHGILDRVYQTGKTAELHEIEVNVGGKRRFFNLTYSARRDDSGRINGIMILGVEITDQIRVRNELRMGEEKLRSFQLRYERVAAASDLGVWYCDLPFSDLIWNPQVKAHFWLPADAQVTIDLFYERIHPEDREKTRRAIEHAISTRTPYDTFYRTTCPEDPERIKWIHAVGWADYDAQGKPTRFDGIALDVTQQKLTEDALRQREERFRIFAEALPQMAFISDAQGNIMFYNRRFFEYVGLPVGVGGWQWQEFDYIHPDDLSLVHERWSHSLRTGEPFEVEHRLRRKDGGYRWHLGRAVPVRDQGGLVTQWLGTNTDIHETKLATEKLKRTATELDQAIRARDEFLSIASHELRTPLTAMKMQTQMFQRDPSRALKVVTVVDRGLNRMARLVDDMLDISRIQTGKLNLAREPADIGSLVQEIMERIKPELSNAGIEVRMQLEPGLVSLVDRFRFEQVLTNLSTNAVRYAPKAPVEISLERVGDSARLRFQDHGPGILEANRERVFEKFERLVSANEVSGMGLGLFICKEIIHGHGGTIQVDSERDQGACFVIDLPLEKKAQSA